MDPIRSINIVCGTKTATLYVLNYEPALEPEYDVSEIYETEETVLKKIDSIITCVNIYCLSDGEENNCLSFIRNKFRNDFNGTNTICAEMYIAFLRNFVIDDHYLVESLRDAFNGTVTISQKYSTGIFLSGSLEDLMNYSKLLKDDELIFILVVFFGKLMEHLPNNAYLHSVCKIIKRLTDCDPCIVRDAPERLQKWYDLVINKEIDEPYYRNHIAVDPYSDSDSDDDWYYNQNKSNIKNNNNYGSYTGPINYPYNYSSKLTQETDKEKAARAIDEYYSKDTIIHQIEWHEKWIEFYKGLCPNGVGETEDLLFEFTALAFNEQREQSEQSDQKENYADGLDDISVNSFSVPGSDSTFDLSDHPLDDFADYINSYNFEDTTKGLYDPVENDSTENILEQDYNPGPSDWIWELD